RTSSTAEGDSSASTSWERSFTRGTRSSAGSRRRCARDRAGRCRGGRGAHAGRPRSCRVREAAHVADRTRGRDHVPDVPHGARPGHRTSARRPAGSSGLMGTRLPIAFLAGFASVITPCVLPLVPGYLSALSSVEPGRLGERASTRRVVQASLPFIAGFTVVFV